MQRVVVTLLVCAYVLVLLRLPGPSSVGPSVAPRATVDPSATAAPPTPANAATPPVRAIITPTGVPLPVGIASGDGWVATTPCERAAVVTGTPIVGAVPVVLDPGHGGPVDTGAQGENGLVEADINLRLSAAAAAILDGRGIRTLLTRTGDYAITLPTRVALAEAVDAEVLLSIHHNAPTADPSPVPGTEIFAQSGSVESSRLGGLVHQYVVAGLSRFEGADWDAAPDAGVLRVRNDEGADAYGMVRRPSMPAVLVEMGYLANPAEAAIFATEAYVEIGAEALADAVEAFLTTREPGTGHQPTARVRNPAASAATIDCQDPPLTSGRLAPLAWENSQDSFSGPLTSGRP